MLSGVSLFINEVRIEERVSYEKEYKRAKRTYLQFGNWLIQFGIVFYSWEWICSRWICLRKDINTLYKEVYNAKENICKKLDVSEDCDVETIIDNLLAIAKILSLKMYEYGEDKVHLKM